MNVSVTTEDIASGVRNNARACPIALAIERAGGIYPLVDAGQVSIDIGNSERWYSLPANAVQFIDDFDCGRAVKPFSFSIRLER